jgi:hypothetical protein
MNFEIHQFFLFYSFVDGDWRHKGVKSTGGPMDECWSRRATLEK